MRLTVHRGRGGGEPIPRKTALCLCGGGMTGALFEVGVLAGYDDVVGWPAANDFDIYVGSSAGASIASLVSQGVPSERAFRSLHEADDPFLPLRQEDVFRADLAPFLKVAKLLIRSAVGTVAARLRRKAYRWADAVTTSSLPAGFFKLDGYSAYLRRFFEREGLSNSFSRLSKELYIVAHDADSAERVVFGNGAFREVDIATAITASSAIPVFFEPVRVGDRDFIDGGIGQVDHIDVAISHGANRIMVINPVAPIRARPGGPRMRDMGFIGIADQASRIANRTRLEFGIKRYLAEYPGIEVLLVEADDADTLLVSSGIMSLGARTAILDASREGARKAFLDTYAHGIRIDQLGAWTTGARAAEGPAAAAPPAEPAPGLEPWAFDPAHSSVTFRVSHMVVSTIVGRFNAWTGAVLMGPGGPARVEVRIETASIDTHESQRDAHLRSADFFDVERFPHMTFVSRAIERLDERRLTMRGELTIRGVSRAVALEVTERGTVGAGDQVRSGFSARAIIDRRDFGLVWNRQIETGGVVVGETIEILLEIAVKKPSEVIQNQKIEVE